MIKSWALIVILVDPTTDFLGEGVKAPLLYYLYFLFHRCELL